MYSRVIHESLVFFNLIKHNKYVNSFDKKVLNIKHIV